MTRFVCPLVFASCALILGAQTSLRAHHSFAAEFDVNQPVTLNAVITKVEWTNPHTYFHVDVTDDAGTVTTWAIEGGAPNALYRAGWKPTSLKAGDRVTIVGSKAKDGSNLANAISFTLADGRCLFAGSSGPNGEATTNCRQAGR
jgi:DNA/RNA endonuclease YhcR with UshA esterase domain